MTITKLDPKPDRLYVESSYNGNYYAGDLLQQAKTGVLKVILFNDNDADGTKDTDETLTGAKTGITATDINGAIRTGSSGRDSVCTFTLDEGFYKVIRAFPAGYELSSTLDHVPATVERGKTTIVMLGSRRTKPDAPKPDAPKPDRKSVVLSASLNAESKTYSDFKISVAPTAVKVKGFIIGDNDTVTLKNIEATGLQAFVIATGYGINVDASYLNIGPTITYGFYIEGKTPARGVPVRQATARAKLSYCTFLDSLDETCVRAERGSDIHLYACNATDTKDRVNKSHPVLRIHGHKGLVEGGTWTGMTKFGPPGVEKTDYTDSVVVRDLPFMETLFNGTVQLQVGLKELVIEARYNPVVITGNLSYDDSGITADRTPPTVRLIGNVIIKGSIDKRLRVIRS